MGLFGGRHHSKEKKKTGWEQAEHAGHNIDGGRGFVMISANTVAV